VISVFKLMEDAEVMETLVGSDSSIVGQSLSKLKFPERAMIGAIVRQGEMKLPEKDLVIEAGDTFILVALPEAIEKIEKLFGRKRRFLPFR